MSTRQVHELALLNQAGKALAEAKTFDEIKAIRDKAEAVRTYARSASLGLQIQNRAAEVKLCAEREAGKLLSQLTLRGGDRRSKNHGERLKLKNLGITRNQSTRWQRQAAVPAVIFREYVRRTLAAEKELSAAGLMRFARWWSRPNCNADAAVPSKRPYAPPRAYRKFHNRPSTEDDLLELVAELKNHHQVLEGLLRPIYTGENDRLRNSDCRIVKYLLRETSQLFDRLEKMRLQEANDAPFARRSPSAGRAGGWPAGEAIPAAAFAQKP